VLDGYLATLSEMTAATCSAGSRRAGHDELVEQRTMCLEARAISVRATIDVLGSADATAVERAPSAVHALPELASCADPLALLGPAAPPSDPAARARIRDLRVELARTQSLYDAGRDTPSLDQARALAGRARQAGYRPLEAEALFLVGRIADDRAETASAEAALGQAVLAADAGRSDELAARALVRLIRLRGKPGPDALEQSQQLAARVTAILERIGGSPEVEGLLHVAISQVRYGAGRYEEAEGEARRGLGLLEHRFGPTDLRVADAVEQLARIAIVRVQPDLALTLTRRVLAIRLAILGGDHPAVATANTGVALALVAVRRYGEAARAFETALAIRERALGRDHPDVGAVLANMTLNDLWQADYDAALVHIRRAVAIAERAYGRRHPIYGRWRCREAGVLIELGHHRDALPVTRDGLAALVATIGSEQLDTAYCRRYLASVLHELGRDREARREALDSLAVQDRLLGSGQPYLSETLRLLGKIDLAAHQSARAVATLERARTLAAPLDAAVRAQLDFDLAQALGDTDRARSLARAARTIAAQDPRLGDDLRAIDAWLARHRLM
jgi:hypothetical protein